MRRLTAVLTAVLLMVTMLIPAQAEGSVTLYSLDDVKLYLMECGQQLDTRIEFSYGAALDGVFGNPDDLGAILWNAGIFDYMLWRNTDEREVTIDGIEYHHGFKIVEYERMGRLNELSQDEWDTYVIAREIADQALSRSSTQLEVERYVHDAICARAEYRLGEGSTVTDSAVGALKYGLADCDGYADAFYLVGCLAGLNIVYQLGEADGGAHMWNRIFLNGTWHHVDLTRNDMKYEGRDICTYRCFNIGSDMIPNYSWREGMSYAEMSYAYAGPYTDWNSFFYTCGQAGQEGFGAYYATLSDAAWYVTDQWQRGYKEAHVMVDGTYADGKQINDWIVNAGCRGKWTTYTFNMGPYSLFDVIFLD